MKPTQSELEKEIEKLAARIALYREKLQSLKIRMEPQLEQMHEKLGQIYEFSRPGLKKAKLGLELIWLKTQLKMVDILIDTKKADRSAEETKEGDENPADDSKISPAATEDLN